jgi:hypothetical protein
MQLSDCVVVLYSCMSLCPDCLSLSRQAVVVIHGVYFQPKQKLFKFKVMLHTWTFNDTLTVIFHLRRPLKLYFYLLFLFTFLF